MILFPFDLVGSEFDLGATPDPQDHLDLGLTSTPGRRGLGPVGQVAILVGGVRLHLSKGQAIILKTVYSRVDTDLVVTFVCLPEIPRAETLSLTPTQLDGLGLVLDLEDGELAATADEVHVGRVTSGVDLGRLLVYVLKHEEV